jgi:hypothetical protein
MRDRLLWGPAFGWTVVIIGVFFTIFVVLGRFPEGVKEKLRPGAPPVLIRVWLGGIGLGLVVSGIGVARQDAGFAFMAILGLFLWATVMRALVSPWMKSRWEHGDRP